MGSPVRSNRGIEENTLAILDSSGIRTVATFTMTVSASTLVSWLAFLEAVRLVSLTSMPSSAPTWNMYNAVFRIFRDGTSLEEIMTSYQLLVELEKHYPRLCLVDQSKFESTFGGACELVVVKETWSPFVGSVESAHADDVETSRSSDSLLDAHGFSFLTHELAQLLKNLVLLQYLVHVLEGDFLPRETVYKATMKWIFLRESLLSLILGSRKINIRYFIQDCMTIISGGFVRHKSGRFHDLENVETSLPGVVEEPDLTLLYATLEMGKKTVIAVEKLLLLVIRLDMHRKVADIQGYTSRADAIRVPLMEMIVDQLSYNKDVISPFLLAFSEPKWKLEIIMQYFWKYCHRSPVHTRRSKNSSDDATFETILKYFSNDVPLLQISKGLICAYENIKKNNDGIRLSAFEKEALFTAATIVALDSQF
ncbi:unnamed protein product [Spirodela intermedia]|uniref:Uncharacterized protein n=1 Tax=Spirodela intermedia TaxID=51605 RepID=A0A7I8JT80_SPIIN|nr:unnamed protein product [Spirodela intermedia]CAA6672642.1 unnamed protein product [Spirodela intermedia]